MLLLLLLLLLPLTDLDERVGGVPGNGDDDPSREEHPGARVENHERDGDDAPARWGLCEVAVARTARGTYDVLNTLALASVRAAWCLSTRLVAYAR